MGRHWIYNAGDIDRRLGGNKAKAAFFRPPSSPFYKYTSGASSPYGDEIQPLLRTLAAHHGQLYPDDFARESAEYYDKYRGRLNSVMKTFKRRVLESGYKYPNTGVNDDQAHALVKVPLLVYAFGNDTALLTQKVEQAVKVHQNNEVAVSLAQGLALMLRQVTHEGKNIQQAIEWGLSSGQLSSQAVKLVNDAKTSMAKSTRDAAGRFGSSCHLPGKGGALTFPCGIQSSAMLMVLLMVCSTQALSLCQFMTC